MELVAKNVKYARCHTFGIGMDVSSGLVKRVALAGKGTYHFINEKETNMNAKVIASLSQAVKPALTNIQVESEGAYL